MQMSSCHLLVKRVLILALASGLTAPVLATNRALIMGISNYVGIQPLLGVPKDISTAQSIARSMGVLPKDMVVVDEKNLTLSGMRNTLRSFTASVQPGDRVFIYFSGHGSSFAADGNKNSCDQGIVTLDRATLKKQEFHSLLDPIKNVVAKLVVFLDTCFSGGVVATGKGKERVIPTNGPQAKFLDLKAAGQSTGDCAEPINVAKALRAFNQLQLVEGTNNFYLLGAAAPNEAAIDGGAARGSYATSALMQCIDMGGKIDRNKDGIVSFDEAKDCAQQLVSEWVRTESGGLFSQQTLTSGAGPGSGFIPVAFSADLPSGTSASAGLPADMTKFLQSLRAGADPAQRVTVTSPISPYRIGRDYLNLRVTSSASGYLTLLIAGTDGNLLKLLPNGLDSDQKIEANVPLQIPRTHWRLPSNGPAGKNLLLALVSGSPDQFGNLGIAPVGSPYSTMQGTAMTAKDIIERTLQPVPGCATQPNRAFGIEPNPCGTRYGAALLDIVEVD